MIEEGHHPSSYQIDVLSILDQLEEFISSSARLPLSDRVIISSDTLLDMIDAVRSTLPHDVVEADRILEQRHRLLETARDRANKMLDEAREQSKHMLQEHHLVKAAELRAEKIRNQTQHEADEMIASAEEYVQRLLGRLESEASRLAADFRTTAERRS